jgi:hypothetical protein
MTLHSFLPSGSVNTVTRYNAYLLHLSNQSRIPSVRSLNFHMHRTINVATLHLQARGSDIHVRFAQSLCAFEYVYHNR